MTKLGSRAENQNAHQQGYLTNNAGAQVDTGDAVVIDTAGASQVVLNATVGVLKPALVVSYDPSGADQDDSQAIANAADGWFQHGGIAKDVQFEGAVAIGDWVKLSNTSNKLETTGDLIGTAPVIGTVGVALEPLGGAGQADVLLTGLVAGVQTSAGAGDAGRLVALDADGNVDATMINDGDIDHNQTTNLTTGDVHTQYFLVAGETTNAQLHSGADLIVYSDAGVTEVGRWDGALGKITAGSFGTPNLVTAARKYGVELHYAGDNYDVTALRARAQLKTTDASTRTAEGALLQASNNDGIDANVLQGAVIEAIGKSSGNAATISTMRGALIGTEWDALDTITDLKVAHVRTHTRNNAGAGSFSNSGYGVYIENEAVGGNGQALTAAIYLKGTALSAGNDAFVYGIDMSGADITTADIKLSDGSVIDGDGGSTLASTVQINVATATDEALILKSTDDNVNENLFETQDSGGTPQTLIAGSHALRIQSAESTFQAIRTVAATAATLAFGSYVMRTTGTAATGFGGALELKLENEGGGDAIASRYRTELFAAATPTHRVYITVYDTSERVVLRSRADGATAVTAIGGRAEIADVTLVIQAQQAGDTPLVLMGAAAQSAALLQLQESDGSAMLDSGDGLGGSIFSGNQQLEDIDFVWATDNEANHFRVDAGLDATRIGDWDTNYAQFAVDGELTLVGAARVEVEMRLALAGTGGGATKPTLNQDFPPFDGWEFDIDDDIHYVVEIPSDADTSLPIEFHIHWFIDEARTGANEEVNWQIVYRAVKEDGTEPVDSGGSTATVSSGDTLIPTVARALLETSVGTIIAANIDQDDVIGVDLSRIDIIDGTDPTDDPIITAVEVHYTANKLGAAT